MNEETNATPFLISLLSSDETGNVPTSIKFLGLGVNPANDGRVFNLTDAEEVVTASNVGNVDLVIDYEHGTDRLAAKGEKAIAAGWIKGFQVKDDGIYADVEWTATASAEISAREYRYISPTFFHDKNGTVKRIVRAALTNSPALDLPALASSQLTENTNQPEDVMNETLKAWLINLLGLAADASEEDIATASSKFQGATLLTADAHTNLVQAVGAEDGAEIETVISCANNLGNPDPGQFVPIATVKGMQEQIATLSTTVEKLTEGNSETKVDEAIAAGKLAPSMRDWALSYCASDPDAFAKYVENAPVIASGESVAPAGAPEKKDDGELSEETIKAVCQATGKSRDEFLNIKKGDD